MICRRRRYLVAGLAMAALLLAALALHPMGRRLVLVAYLVQGDWRAPVVTPSGGQQQVVLEMASPTHRQALTRGHGAMKIAPLPGGDGVLLTAGPAAGAHEVCSRRLPRDWTGYPVLRLEIEAAGAAPVHLTLRARARPGLRATAWYYQRVLLAKGIRRWEVSLAPAGQFIPVADMRQLCLALRRLPGQKETPALRLRGAVLARTWAGPDRRLPTEPAQPLSLHILGDSTRLRRHDRPPRQAHLLGPEGAIALRSARNETLAFQLVLRGNSQKPLPDAEVSLSPVQGPDGYPLDAALFGARYIRVRQPSSAMYGLASPGAGEYPDPLAPLAGPVKLGKGNSIVWVDIHVPANAPPGTYRASLEVKLPYHTYRWPLGLEVVPLSLPAAGRQLVMVYYLPQLIEQATGLGGEALFRLERAYHRLAQAHGAFLVYDTGTPKLTRYLPMLDGSLYRDGPAPGVGAPYWPVSLNADDRQGIQGAATAAVRWFRDRGLKARPFAYLADEPGSAEAYRDIIQRAGWVHASPAPGGQLPVLVTEQVAPEQPGWPSLVGAVDYWVSADNFPEPAASRQRRTKERFFTYNGRPPQSGSQLLDAPGTGLRTWGWIAHRFDMDMWFLWQGAYYRDIYNGGPRADPLVTAETYDRRRLGKGTQLGNGDGVLIYPPALKGGPPLGSMRLKAMRRGVQDLLYLRLAEQRGHGDKVRALLERLVPRALGEVQEGPPSWPQDEAPWEEARNELIDLLISGGPNKPSTVDR